VAGALKAKRLLLLTDVPGVLDKSKKLIPELSVKDARKLIADGTISGGMIPKVETMHLCAGAGRAGVVIIDWQECGHAVLLELFTNQGHRYADPQVTRANPSPAMITPRFGARMRRYAVRTVLALPGPRRSRCSSRPPPRSPT